MVEPYQTRTAPIADAVKCAEAPGMVPASTFCTSIPYEFRAAGRIILRCNSQCQIPSWLLCMSAFLYGLTRGRDAANPCEYSVSGRGQNVALSDLRSDTWMPDTLLAVADSMLQHRIHGHSNAVQPGHFVLLIGFNVGRMAAGSALSQVAAGRRPSPAHSGTPRHYR